MPSMTTARRNTPESRSSGQSGFCRSSSRPEACIVASSAAPQLAACAIAAMSSAAVISSTAMTCGFIARSTMPMPCALGQSVSTSVCVPNAICASPPAQTAISPRSSTTATRSAGRSSLPSESVRMRSRRSVVLPPPGGESRSVLRKAPAQNRLSAVGSARPIRSVTMRSESEEISRRLATAPFRSTAVPHTPSRKPPCRHRNPCRSVSAQA